MNTLQRSVIALLLVAGLQVSQAADGFKAGLEVRGDAQIADIGLPPYPGAVPQRDEGEEGPGATIGLWGGSLGFRLVVLKFASSDGVEPVARFYRDALARSGPVLDCSRPEPKPAPGAKGLRCDSDRPATGGQLYKAGQPNRLQMVAVEPGPQGRGSRFVLLRMVASAP